MKHPQQSVCFQERPLVVAIRHALPYLMGLSLALSMVQTASSRSSDSAAAFTATQLVRQFTLKNTVSQVSMGMQGYVAEVNGQQRGPAMGARPPGFPSDMGSVPTTVNLPRRDGAGRPLGYCAWDNATALATADYNAGQGISNPLVYAIVSPGLNGNMQTTCADVLATGSGVGDDHVQVAAPMQVSSVQYKSAVGTFADLPPGVEGDVRLVRDTNKLYSYVGGVWAPVQAGPFEADAGGGAGAIAYTTGKVTVADFQAATASITGALSGSSATFTGAVTANTFTGNGAGLVDLNADNFSSGVLGPQFGGTGVNASAAANGTLLIGNGSGFTLGTLTGGAGISVLSDAGAITLVNSGVISITGTADQVIASANNGDIVLSLPQAIATTSMPTFAGMMLNGGLTGTTANFSGAVTVGSLGAQRLDVSTSAGGLATPNMIVGTGAMLGTQSGFGGNTALGINALRSNTTGYANTATGSGALISNTTGIKNTATGWGALEQNTSGSDNTVMGNEAAYVNTTGYRNTATGARALFSNSTGYDNVAVGNNALRGNTTGFENVALGRESGFANTTGSSNTFLGYSADATTGALTYATAIGALATVATSNTLALGRNSTADQVVIGTNTRSNTYANTKLYVNGVTNLNGDLRGTTATFSGAVNALSFAGDGSALTNLNASNFTTGNVPVARGGTGLDGSAAPNGSLLIGNGTGYSLNTLTGTANQVNVTNGAGTITLSLPQSIATTSTPTFGGITSNGAVNINNSTVTFNNVTGDKVNLWSGFGFGINTSNLTAYVPNASDRFSLRTGGNFNGTEVFTVTGGGLITSTGGISTTTGTFSGNTTVGGNLSVGGNLVSNLNVTQGNFVRFGHANELNADDGKIGAGLFGEGLNIVGTKTTVAGSRLVSVYGNTTFSGDVTASTLQSNAFKSISSQGAHLQWNRDGASGRTYLINQRGGGGGGISFGESTTGDAFTQNMFLDASGNLSVVGSVTANSFSGTTAAFSGNTTVGGTLGVTGATTLGGTLGVTGATTLGGTLGVTGATTLTGALAANGGISSTTGSFSGNVTASTFQSFAFKPITSQGVHLQWNRDGASGRTYLINQRGGGGGGISFGEATTGDVYTENMALSSTGNLTVVGSVTASGGITGTTANFSGNTSVGGTLTVTGGTTLNGAVAVNNSEITFNDILGDKLNLYTGYGFGINGGNLTAYVSGNTDRFSVRTGGTYTGTEVFTVTGGGLITSTGGISTTTGAFSGNTTVGGTLAVTGATTLNGAVAVNNSAITFNNILGNKLNLFTGYGFGINGNNLTAYVPGGADRFSLRTGGTYTGSEVFTVTGGGLITSTGGISTTTGAFSGNTTVGGTLAVTGGTTLNGAVAVNNSEITFNDVVGDKLNLYTDYGFGINGNNLTAFIPSASQRFSVRTGGTYTGFEVFTVSGAGNVSLTGGLAAGGAISGTTGTFSGAVTVNSLTAQRINVSTSAGGGSFANMIVGTGAMAGVQSGTGANTALGINALNANTTGYANTGSGYRTLEVNTSGYGNTANGSDVLRSNTTGYNNTASGYFALANTTTGFDNTATGRLSGSNNTTGSNNTFLGAQANATTGALTYATAIGAGSTVATSGTIALGRIFATDQVVLGTDTRNDTFANTKLYVNGVTSLNGDLRGTTATFSGNTTVDSLLVRGSQAIATQGSYLQWNRDGGSGRTFLVNQRGGGGGGISFGEVTTGNAYTENMALSSTGNLSVVGSVTANGGITSNGAVNVNNSAITFNNVLGNKLNLYSGFGFGINGDNLTAYVPGAGQRFSLRTGGNFNGAEVFTVTGGGLITSTGGISTTTGSFSGALTGTTATFSGNTTVDSLFVRGSQAIATQGSYLQWNRDGGSGRTFLVNQRGGGGGGISFGEVTTGNVYTENMTLSSTGNLVSAGSITANGGLSTTTGTFSGAVGVSGNLSGNTAGFGGAVTTGGLLTANSGMQLATGSSFRFGVFNENTDDINVARLNVAGDASVLRFTLGDNGNSDGFGSDEFQFGSIGFGTFTNSLRIAPGSGDVISRGYMQATSFNATSDRRLKKNITVQENNSVLERLEQLQTYSYEYINAPSVGRRIGVIAQEIQSLFPEAVSTSAENGMMSVDYNALGAMAAMGVGQLNSKFKVLDGKVTLQGEKLLELDGKVAQHNTRIGALESWKTEAVTRMDNMQGAIDLNIQKIAENTLAIQTNTKAIERLDDALLTLDGTVKGNTDAIAAINARWARNFTAAEDGSSLTVNAVELKVSNFTAQQMRTNSLYTQRLEAEIAKIAELEVNNLRANTAVANTVQAEQVNTGSIQVYAGVGLPAVLFAAKADGHYTVSTSALDGSYATATVIVNAGQAKVVSVSSEGIELVAEGNMVKAIAAGKSIKASWIKMG
ncbi:MAG: tail fiber domain-containing protein [Gammaproteobacteria bacterium]|nr:tail fiber domain-containing protein [Gammaproteobacteria bacterium]